VLQGVARCCSVLECVAVQGLGFRVKEIWTFHERFKLVELCRVIEQIKQCVAGCCRVLQGVAGCCRELRFTDVELSSRSTQGVAGCCRVLQGVAGCCKVLRFKFVDLLRISAPPNVDTPQLFYSCAGDADVEVNRCF